ncbi:MAG: dipeptidase [Syntrophomonadaceae bacterium]|jgi:membrane dipeptidase
MIDLHCDTLSRLVNSAYSLQRNPFHLDIERAREAGMTGQIFALFHYHRDYNVTLRVILEQIAVFNSNLQGAVGAQTVMGYDGLRETVNRQELACILHLEGADALGNDAALWPLFHRLGVRSLGLTWNHNNAFAGGVLDAHPIGLSAAGRRLLDEMERLGSVLDLAHVAEDSYYQALDYYCGPVMVSHANARSRCNHPRNLDDRQFLALAEHEGIIGVNLVPAFVHSGLANMSYLLDHIEYICDLIGVQYVALGSDFDGADELLLSGVEACRNWASLLKGRGFSDPEISAILHDNAYNFLTRAFLKKRDT